MRKVLAVVFILALIASSVPVSAKIQPYVYTPTVPDTSFAVLALYKVGNYAQVLEGCEWLMAIRTPFDSWGYKYGEEHEAKYTAMAMLALMRGERIARGRYNATINSAAYWLIYRQNPNGSWEDYLGTALSVLALKEFLKGGYINEKLVGFEKQVKEAINRGEGYLYATKPRNDLERIFGYLALGDVKDLEDMKVSRELAPYRAFALAYLGKKVELSGDLTNTPEIAMALYSTGNEKYLRELLKREHFGFWGKLHYRVLDLISVSKVEGFSELRETACPYLSKIRADNEWEKVILADYYITCGRKPQLPENITSLLPWQVAEVARIKAYLGENYEKEINRLLSIEKNGTWRDFYNTEYVIWVFKTLNISYDYSKSLNYLAENLTWMLNATDKKTGNPVYYNIPTYYFAYAVIVFKEFGMERELNETLAVLKERQYPNGAFPYTQGSIAGITSTAKVLWALQQAGLTNTTMYKRGESFLRELLYADIPEPKVENGTVVLTNATFLLIKGSRYVGNSTGRAELDNLDGYVAIYPSKGPLAVMAKNVRGFKAVAEENKGSVNYVYIILVGALLLVAIAVWKKR